MIGSTSLHYIIFVLKKYTSTRMHGGFSTTLNLLGFPVYYRYLEDDMQKRVAGKNALQHTPT